jgi:ubiquinone/menaquinone biosynthesis C-methylase UbiE
MCWITLAVSLVILISIGILIGMRPMKIAHEPAHEGVETVDARLAYNSVSRWPIFNFERYVILRALNQFKPKGRLMDIGCGPGYLVARISRRYPYVEAVGLDNNEMAVTLAKNNWPSVNYNNLEFILGDTQELPISSNSVDFIVSSLSMHHWTDVQLVFQEFHRVLKPGGQLLVFDLRRDAPHYFYCVLKFGQAFFAPKVIRKINCAVGSFWAAYTPSEIQEIVNKLPLENLRIKSSFGWMLISASKASKF